MRELDVILERFVDRDYALIAADEQAAFESLLTLQDPEILELITGRTIAENSALRNVVQRLLTNP